MVNYDTLLEPQGQPVFKWMEMVTQPSISYVKIGNHPIETKIYEWLDMGFQVVLGIVKLNGFICATGSGLNSHYFHRHVSKNRGKPPKWMVKIMENPIKIDDLGVPLLFGNTHLQKKKRGGDFKYFLFSPRKFGEMIQFDEHIFQLGWFNHQLEKDE